MPILGGGGRAYGLILIIRVLEALMEKSSSRESLLAGSPGPSQATAPAVHLPEPVWVFSLNSVVVLTLPVYYFL